MLIAVIVWSALALCANVVAVSICASGARADRALDECM